MSGRLWYPQLDVYDSIRRIGVLLRAFERPPGVERLSIADFYLANPPLLHNTTMSRETRKAFSAIEIPRPNSTFLTYPAAPLLFHKMEPIQKEALRALAGKGLISMPQFQIGITELTDSGHQVFKNTESVLLTAREAALVRFLARDFATTVEAGAADLRRRTGLRRGR